MYRSIMLFISILCLISSGEERKKPPVVVKCNNGVEKSFSNDRSDLSYGSDSLYKLEAEIKDKFAFISFWKWHGEFHRLIMINESNCSEKVLEGYPIFNENNYKLILHGFDIEAGFYWNGIKIINMKNGKFEIEFSIEPELWGPRDIKWIGNDKIHFKKSVINREYKDEKDSVYIDEFIEIIFENGKWMLKPV